MKINFILPFTYLTGGIRVAFIYSNYLVANGHDVICYVPMKAYKFNYNIFTRIKASIGNTIKRREKVTWFNCNFKIKLVPMINNTFVRDADITIATAWPTAYDVEKLNNSKGKKVYLIQGYEVWSGPKEKVNMSYKLNLNRIVITKELKELFRKKFNVNSTVIYNGLDDSEYIQSEKDVYDRKTVMMMYSKEPIKGSVDGINVINRLREKHNIDVILYGLKKDSSIPKHYKFYENPTREQLMTLYEKADIYLFTSKHESWGLPAMEAMANKCAVVGNKVGCLLEIATNGKDALIIENFDYNKMFEMCEYLINNKKKLKQIQDNAYLLAKKFRWDKSFNLFEEYLYNIIK